MALGFKHHLQTLHILNQGSSRWRSSWLDVPKDPVFSFLWENSPWSLHLVLYASKSKTLLLNLQSPQQISIFPLIQTWLSQVKVMKPSHHSSSMFLPVNIVLGIRHSFHLGMKKGKQAIIIRIKPKLITQGVTIYLWFYQNALNNYSIKYTAYTGDDTWYKFFHALSLDPCQTLLTS